MQSSTCDGLKQRDGAAAVNRGFAETTNQNSPSAKLCSGDLWISTVDDTRLTIADFHKCLAAI